MNGQLYTGRYSTFEPSMGVPVGITLGKPKFPLRYGIVGEVEELKPRRMFKLQGEAFERAFRAQLDRVGVETLTARFQSLAAEHGGPLVLLCFEAAGDESCHRRVFARWWTEQTLQEVPEAELGTQRLRLAPEAEVRVRSILRSEARRRLRERQDRP